MICNSRTKGKNNSCFAEATKLLLLQAPGSALLLHYFPYTAPITNQKHRSGYPRPSFAQLHFCITEEVCKSICFSFSSSLVERSKQCLELKSRDGGLCLLVWGKGSFSHCGDMCHAHLTHLVCLSVSSCFISTQPPFTDPCSSVSGHASGPLCLSCSEGPKMNAALHMWPHQA